MHVEIYTIKGRQYKYQVMNYRVGGKVKHHKNYLGPVQRVNPVQRKKGAGRKPSVFARAVTDDERAQLQAVTRSNNAFAKERAAIILRSSSKETVKQICSQAGREKRSVLAAIHAFNKSGIACLAQGKRSGRKPVFSSEQRALIIQELSTSPRALGLRFTTWSLPKLREHIISKKIVNSISIETLRQIIKHGNKKFKKSRKWCFSNDPDFAKKKLVIDALKANAPPGSVVLSFDEKGKTPVKHFEGRAWVCDRKPDGKNSVYKVSANQKVKGLVDYLAAKDIHSGRVYHACYDWKNAFIVIDFFERLLQEIPDKTLYVLVDCWSAHRAAVTRAFADLNSRLKLVFLPTNASWMNNVERYFSSVERDVLRNSDFGSARELVDALFAYPELSTAI